MAPKLLALVHDLWPRQLYASRAVRLWILYMSGLICVAVLVMVGTATPSFFEVKQFQAPMFEYPIELSLSADIVSIDPAARSITIDWFPLYVSPDLVNCTERILNPIIREIYVPRALMDHTSPTWRQDPPHLPVFEFNTNELCPIVVWPQIVSFRTVTKLYPRSKDSSQAFLSSGIQAYPEERYEAPFELYTRNPNNGAMRALAVYNLTAAVLSFELSISDTRLMFGPLPGDDRLQFSLIIARSKTVKIFVYAAAAMSWLVTLAFLTIVAAAGIYKSHHIHAEMFVVPIGALFAFTSIRANLPGAPEGFGTVLDTFSIIPVLIIVSLTSFVLLISVLHKRIRYALSAEESLHECGCHIPSKAPGVGSQADATLDPNHNPGTLSRTDTSTNQSS